MSDKEYGGENPPLAKNIPLPRIEELMAVQAARGTLAAFLIDIGWYYDHPSPSDRDRDR